VIPSSSSWWVLGLLCAAGMVGAPACTPRESQPVAGSEKQEPTLGGMRPGDADAIDLASKAAGTLAKIFRSVSLETTQAGTTVTVAGTPVAVATRINNRVRQANQHIVAAEFDVSVGGIRSPELVAGVVGIGDSPDTACDSAVEEWAGQYGIPIGFAVAARLGASGPPARGDETAKFYAMKVVDGQTLFHGLPGLRGAAKQPETVVSDEFLRRVAEVVVAGMRQRASSGQYRSATVQVVVKGPSVTDGECRIDGVASPDVLKVLSRWTWPEGAPSYMFKLFFVAPIDGR
jgi:hypothetical protein